MLEPATLLFALVAAAAPEPVVEKIRDNLFLLEEAYNQEPGVIQHIQVLQLASDGWAYSFTEEWPVPEDVHQLSLTLPLLHQKGGDNVEVGDLMINYRYQAVGQGGVGAVAFAPRLSLVLPTGHYDTGAGRGNPGLQINLPVSLDLHTKWVLHVNAGLTWTPRARAISGERASALDTTVGAAIVWLPLKWANLVLEVMHQSTADVAAGGGITRQGAVVFNPGARFAIDFDSGLQIVPGFSVPIERSSGITHTSVVLYLSFEHPMWAEPPSRPES